MESFICKFNPTKENIFRENRLISLGICGEAELILGIWGAKVKYFQGAEDFSGIWGDQCIILGGKGAQNPLGPHYWSIINTPLNELCLLDCCDTLPPSVFFVYTKEARYNTGDKNSYGDEELVDCD